MSLAYETYRAKLRIAARGDLKSWHQNALELIERNKLITSKEQVLVELGTSACELLEQIRESYGCRCIAADFPQEALKFAQSLGFETRYFDGNDPQSIPESDNGIADVVVSTATLEHITDVDATLAIVRRLLKPHGYFVLAVPNCTSYKHWLHYVYRGIPRDEGHHYRHFAWTNTVRTLVLNGFDIVDQNHEIDDRLPVKVLNFIVNAVRAVTESLARRITSIKLLAHEGLDNYTHLKVINWAFLLRKDPEFMVIENPYIRGGEKTEDKVSHTIRKINTKLLGEKIISSMDCEMLIGKISGMN